MKLIRFILIFSLFVIFISISAFSYATVATNDISNSVFRLHVIANSDSKEDQALKYKVRDSLLTYMNSLCTNITSKEDAINIVSEHLNDFSIIAKNIVEENGYNYPVNVSIDKSNFPTKYYGDIVLPPGIYDALKVKIGNATGQNWWCVMFPPLCFVDINSGTLSEDSKQELKQSLTEDEYDLINVDSSAEVSYKFKIIEIIQDIKTKIAKNN